MAAVRFWSYIENKKKFGSGSTAVLIPTLCSGRLLYLLFVKITMSQPVDIIHNDLLSLDHIIGKQVHVCVSWQNINDQQRE